MKDLFDKIAENKGPLGKYAEVAEGYFAFPKLEGSIGNRMLFNGKEVITWSVNDYLGLANHPEVRKADIEASKKYGTEVQDQMKRDNKKIKRISNNLGGFEGGMSTGEPIMVTSYLKPISTTLTPIKSVDLHSRQNNKKKNERSDTCAVPRAVPIFEGVLSLDLLNSLLEKTGGDSKDEIAKRVDELQNYNIDNFQLSNKKWKMGYENE